MDHWLEHLYPNFRTPTWECKKVEFFFKTVSGGWVSPPPMIVHTTEVTLIFEQNHHSWVPTTSQKISGKKPGLPMKLVLKFIEKS